MRFLPPAAATATVAAVLALAACGGSGGAAPRSSATQPAKSQPSASASAPANGPLHGIILANRTDYGVQLVAVNPQTGAVQQTRQFSGHMSGAALAMIGPWAMVAPGPIWRQSFDAGFTKVAASGPQQPDGSHSAGYVDIQGAYHPLTASTSGGYGTTLAKSAIGFDPAGNMWYGVEGDPGQFGMVTPAGKDTLFPADRFDARPGAVNELVPDGHGGYMPLTGLAHVEQVYLPGGPEVRRDPVMGGYKVGAYGAISDETATTPTDPASTVPWMAVPVDSHRFVGLLGDAPQKGYLQIWAGSVGGAVHLHPLLPDSNRTVTDVAVSSDRTQVAFVSVDAGGQPLVYVTSLSAVKNQPRPLGAAGGDMTEQTGLLAWLP